MIPDSTIATWAPRMLSVLRIVAALLFMAHGTQKLLGFPPSDDVAGGAVDRLDRRRCWSSSAAPRSCSGCSRARSPSCSRARWRCAYWMAHAPQSFFPVQNGGDSAVLFCFVFLYIVFAGPGPWSLDALRLRDEARA